MRRFFSFFGLCSLVFGLCAPVLAADLFDKKEPVQGGLNVFDTSAVFANIYEKLDTVKWAGKDIGVAVESLEKLYPDSAHIAATGDRIVLVWKDTIIGNWPRPSDKDWGGYGQITTALLLKFRERVPEINSLSDSGLYSAAVSALLRGIDENGRYIFSDAAEIAEDGRILTSAGLEGLRDEQGNFRIKGIYKGSPADSAGVKEGDLVFEVNGREVAELTDGELASAFAGFNSGTLKLSLADSAGSRRVVLRRATVVLADADVVLRTTRQKAEGIGQETSYLEIVIHKVSENSVSIANEALSKHKGADGIILDLRAATGGDERSAAKMAGLFVGKVPVLRVIETAKEELEVVPGGNAITNAPVVVLVSGATSGTAEAVAAAFYEQERAVLVGTPTAGNARLTTNLDLENGGHLELLNRAVKTGAGRNLDGRGIFPLVCLSNIRNAQQQEAFFINVVNGDFKAKDLNRDDETVVADIRKGCPQMKSGEDEDLISAAVATQILSNDKIYKKLSVSRGIR
jgi:carboxyl-terminal processing protease